jgi:hypothetical protein
MSVVRLVLEPVLPHVYESVFLLEQEAVDISSNNPIVFSRHLEEACFSTGSMNPFNRLFTEWFVGFLKGRTLRLL